MVKFRAMARLSEYHRHAKPCADDTGNFPCPNFFAFSYHYANGSLPIAAIPSPLMQPGEAFEQQQMMRQGSTLGFDALDYGFSGLDSRLQSIQGTHNEQHQRNGSSLLSTSTASNCPQSETDYYTMFDDCTAQRGANLETRTNTSGSADGPSQNEETPRCHLHGCNGRVFSSWSNLRRHQRERGGVSPKVFCPRCGAHFSRTSARNQHLANLSCTRIRRYSNGRERPSMLKVQESMMKVDDEKVTLAHGYPQVYV